MQLQILNNFNSGTFNIGTLIGTNTRISPGVVMNCDIANITNTTNNLFFSTLTGSEIYFNCKQLNINSAVALSNVNADVYLNIEKMTATGAVRSFQANAGFTIYANIKNLDGTNFISSTGGRVALNIDNLTLSTALTFLSNQTSVRGRIGNVTLAESTLINGLTLPFQLDIGEITVTGTTTTTPVINLNINSTTQNNINIGKVNFGTAVRSFSLNGTRLNMSIGDMLVTNASTTAYVFRTLPDIEDTYNIKNIILASTTANSVFFLKQTSTGTTTVMIDSIYNTASNFSRLFENGTASGVSTGPMVVNVRYGRIDSELFRITGTSTVSHVKCDRLESTANVNLITCTGNTATLEFGGSLKTAGTNILANSATGFLANILPSKFVSNGNCISSTLLTTMYFAPTVTKNGVNVLQVTVVPLGNLTVAAGMN
jgi:hypothetical protein